MRGRLYVGTSGFAYKTWKPDFYPAKLKASDMLRYYAERLPSVEINNTFYRMPSETLLAGWRDETPARFVFTLKAPQRITHIKRLGDVGDVLAHFLATARTLDERLGCILFQCPPYLHYDADRLEAFLDALPADGMRFAMEFRHPSWDAARPRLASRSITWCVVDGDDAETSLDESGFVYLRLRRPAYDEAALRAWAERLRPVLDAGRDAYVYFKHEDDPSGVAYARALLKGTGGEA